MHPAAPRSSCACPHSLPFIIIPLDDPLLPSHHPGSNFHPFFQSNLSTFHSNLFGFRFFARAHAPVLVLHHHPGCHCPPNSTGTPPAHLLALCHPHQPPPSQIFDFFDFLCTGPAPTTPAPPAQSARALAPPAHPSTHLHAPFRTPAHTLRTFCALLHTFSRTFAHPHTPLCTIAHLFVHIHAPSRTLVHLCAPFAHLSRTSVHPCTPLRTLVHLSMHIHTPPCSLCTPSAHLPCTHAHFVLHLPGLSPLSDFLFNLGPPSGYHGQPSPSATGHSAHSRTSV